MAVYRNDATLARIRLLFAMVALVGLGMGLVGLIRLAGASRPGGSAPWATASLIAFGLAGLFFVRRVSRVAIETHNQGVTVRNVATTRRFAWSQIERFEEVGSRRGVTQAVVRTSRGKAYPLTACGDPGAECTKTLARLRSELAAARAG